MLKTPTRCDDCGGIYVTLWEVRPEAYAYSRRKAWPFVYKCHTCGAECGLKQETVSPMGIMATSETRFWRTKAHRALDKLWQHRRGIPRSMAYMQLAAHMGISTDDCHIANFNIEQCQQVIEFSSELLPKIGKKRRK